MENKKMENVRTEGAQLEALIQLVKKQSETIERLIRMVEGKEETGESDCEPYILCIKMKGSEKFEPAVDVDGSLVAGDIEQVKKRRDFLMGFTPTKLQQSIDSIILKIDKKTISVLKGKLQELYENVEKVSEKAVDQVSNYVYDKEKAVRHVKENILKDFVSRGVAIDKDGKVVNSEIKYWSQLKEESPELFEVEDDYYDYDDDEDYDYDDYDDCYDDEDEDEDEDEDDEEKCDCSEECDYCHCNDKESRLESSKNNTNDDSIYYR